MQASAQKTKSKATPHRWSFFRSGGFDQVRLDAGSDVAAVGELDQKLWAALACPIQGVEFDKRTLQLLDHDKDGRIRVPEVLAAVSWTTSLIKNSDDFAARPEALPLAAINDSVEDGAKLLASAKQILENLGRADATHISPADTADTAKIFAGTKFNGDGVITVATAEDAFTKSVIQDIIDCLGAQTDLSGEPGVTAEMLAQFKSDAQTYSDWWSLSEREVVNVLPNSAATEKAAADFEKVKGKVDDYFTRCRFAKFDGRAATHLNRAEAELDAIAGHDLTETSQELAAFPLALIEVDKPLPLTGGLNPAWEDAIFVFRDEVIKPLFGSISVLSFEQWRFLNAKFSAYRSWKSSEPETKTAKLGRDRVRAILAGNALNEIFDLIKKDKMLEQQSKSIAAVERLARYYCYLHQLLNNFVSFGDFYTRKGKAIFQIGTLYLDSRACELCIQVADIDKHSTLAPLSKIYLAYCECTRRGSGEKMMIAAAFTGGDSDNLLVGRNGIFYDRQGRDWDATIVKIIENPISIRQAFWAPYKRVGRAIEQQIEKMAAARDKAAQEKAIAGATGAGEKLEAAKASPTPFDVAKFAGIFAAIGLAVGAIGTMLSSVATSFASLPLWQMPLAILGVVFGISIPSMVMAALKLRQRNLAPLLDASGWSVNTRAKINIPFGGALTGVAKIPEGSIRSVNDPFAEKKRPWKAYIFLALLLGVAYGLWNQGYLQRWYDEAKQYITQSADPAPESGDNTSAQ